MGPFKGGAGEEDDDFGGEVFGGVFAVVCRDGGHGECVDFFFYGLLPLGKPGGVVPGEGLGDVLGEHEGGELPVEIGVGEFGHEG